MKKFIVSTLIFIQIISAFALAGGGLKYSISEIPDSLKKNANCVLRVSETTFHVYDDFKALNTVMYAVTLLNSKSLDDAKIRVFYDNNSSVNYLKFKIYNAIGEDITHSFKTLDVTDESATPEGTLYSDDRCKVVSPSFAQYPVTIEYSYEVKSKIIAYYPSWQPITSTNMSLQHASLTLITPKAQVPRIKEVYLMPKAMITSDAQNEIYFWKISNIAAVETEPYSPPYYELIPFLLLAPDRIKYEDYDYSFNSWDDFGKFQSYLNQGRDLLPPETVKKVEDLVKECKDKRSKIKKVYQYMQDRTRYVGVQVEIGGWQPIPADYVDKKGYGDCKGLVNYTKALLKSIGIESYYSVVKAGNNSAPIISDFPSEQFNHIILCVSDDRDTIWLECTSQRNAFGFLGSFTDNRDALIVNDNGGTLVKTIAYSAKDNSSLRKASVNIDNKGDASLKISTQNKAFQSEAFEALNFDSPENQRKQYVKSVGYSDCIINSLTYNLTGDFIPVGTEEVELFVPAFASRSGNRFFVPVIMPDRGLNIPRNSTPRVNPVVVRSTFSDCDSVTVTIPDGFDTEFIPDTQLIDSKFGKYMLSVEKLDKKLYCYRYFILFSGRYEAAEYPDFVAFLKRIAKLDQTKVVLTQKN